MKVCIIGAGPAGIISAISICNTLKNKKLDIDIYDPGTPFRGRSLNTYSKSMLMNTSIGVTFINPDEPDGLMTFIKEREKRDVNAGEFVTRDSFSCFLEHEFKKVNPHTGHINFINEEVSCIYPDKMNNPCIMHNNKESAYDAVVIATGLPFRALPDFFPADKVILPYPSQGLTKIKRDALVLIIGSHLSAVDTLVHLAESDHSGRINIYSHEHLLPSVRNHVMKEKKQKFLEDYLQNTKNMPNDFSKIDYLTESFKNYLTINNMNILETLPIDQGTETEKQLSIDIKNCQDKTNAWESILMDIIDALNDTWPSLHTPDKIRFQKEVFPWIGRIIASMPLRNGKIIEELFHKKQIHFLNNSEFSAINLSEYDVIVNATGHLPAENDKLLSQLSANKMIRFNGCGGISINKLTHRVNDDIPIYATGMIVQGEVFTANSIYSTSYGSQKIANNIRDTLNKAT
ncbi:FAD/NAD(P)-binding protein [Serratia sp. T13T92]|uniref:FAD/NAD(P)-binding protein n=1 Tax=Serratia sp. T13T92 TaxID=3397496 RepID=UPI0039DF66E6